MWRGFRAVLDRAGILLAASQHTAASASFCGVVRLDPRFDRLVAQDAILERIADGFAWVEGPVWDHHGGHLLFSDIPRNSVLKWDPKAGVSLFLKPSGYSGSVPFKGREPGSNGLAFDAAGRLVLCEQGDRRITRLEKDGHRTVLADRYQGQRLNSPNDLAFKSNGDLYFTDPPFGLPKTFNDPHKELGFSGVYRLTPGGELTLLTSEIKAPNGIAFSPDERRLYVSNTDRNWAVWLAYEVRLDGALANGRVFFDGTAWAKTRKGAPDGMKVDMEGNLFAAGPGGVYVIAPDGTHLGMLETGVRTSNVGWGDDGSVLYITASTAIYRITLNTKGIGFG
jgi:gluconolactonase